MTIYKYRRKISIKCESFNRIRTAINAKKLVSHRIYTDIVYRLFHLQLKIHKASIGSDSEIRTNQLIRCQIGSQHGLTFSSATKKNQ